MGSGGMRVGRRGWGGDAGQEEEEEGGSKEAGGGGLCRGGGGSGLGGSRHLGLDVRESRAWLGRGVEVSPKWMFIGF